MNKIQLDNLIRFNTIFVDGISGGDILNHNDEYILEKWDKYIGIYNFKEDVSSFDISETSYYTVLNGVSIPINKVNIRSKMLKWKELWGDKKYESVKNILYYILVTKADGLLPSVIIENFEKIVGSVDDINTYPGPKLHTLVEMEIDRILKVNKYKRDYELNILL